MGVKPEASSALCQTLDKLEIQRKASKVWEVKSSVSERWQWFRGRKRNEMNSVIFLNINKEVWSF